MTFTHAQKKLIRTAAIAAARADGHEVLKVRLLADRFTGCLDAKAYCADGSTFWVAPAEYLFRQTQEAYS
jgi:hypothetical protein